MVTWIQTLALDIAGLGLLGAGAYALVSGHGGEAASAALLSLGGGYLGYKVAASTTTVVPAPASVKDTPVVVAPPANPN